MLFCLLVVTLLQAGPLPDHLTLDIPQGCDAKLSKMRECWCLKMYEPLPRRSFSSTQAKVTA
jgi:hypothetical protein